MEEKKKNIIFSIIAILLGLIAGGCTQVKAETSKEALESFVGSLNISVRNNLNYAYVTENMLYPINIENGSYTGTTSREYNDMIDVFLKKNTFIKIRMCSIGQKENIIPVSVSEQGIYGKPNIVKVYNTSTNCEWSERTGKEVEIIMEIWNGKGMYNYVDLDTGKYRHQIDIQLNMIASSEGIVAKIRYVWSDNMNVPEDAIETSEETLNNIQNILNQGKFDKPSKDQILEEYDKEEKKLWEILGVPNYNDLNINIDSNTNNKIWNLIVYILNQNTAILTMVITILSISILKLIMNR